MHVIFPNITRNNWKQLLGCILAVQLQYAILVHSSVFKNTVLASDAVWRYYQEISILTNLNENKNLLQRQQLMQFSRLQQIKDFQSGREILGEVDLMQFQICFGNVLSVYKVSNIMSLSLPAPSPLFIQNYLMASVTRKHQLKLMNKLIRFFLMMKQKTKQQK